MGFYLESNGSNSEQKSDEEEKDEGEGCVSHIIFFFLHGAFQFIQDFWM